MKYKKKEPRRLIYLCYENIQNNKCQQLNKNQCNYKIITNYDNKKCYQLMSNEEYIIDRKKRLYNAIYGEPKEK